MKEYKYILLDLDGTITDPMIGITRCVEYALNHFGIQVEPICEIQVRKNSGVKPGTNLSSA